MKRVLVMSPHADDETLGMGGTISRLVDEGCAVTVAVLTGPGTEPHPLFPSSSWETVRAEAKRAFEILGVNSYRFYNLPAVLVPNMPVHEVNRLVRDCIEEFKPEALYLPFLWDLHLDHRSIFYASIVGSRPCSELGRSIRQIYAYETMSETHWAPLEPPFTPNHFVDISDYLDRKLEALACYESQIRPAPDARSLDVIQALAKWRGGLVGCFASEAFMLVRELY